MRHDRGSRNAWRQHLGSALLAELIPRLTDGTLPLAFHQTARNRPDFVALRVDNERVTHGEVDDAAAAVAGWLRERLPAGARVVVMSPNSIAFVTAYVGVLRAGCVAVVASPALTEPELRHLVVDAGTKIAFSAGDSHDDLVRLVDDAAAPVHTVVALEPRDARTTDTLSAIIRNSPRRPPEALDSSDTAVLAYTSGTTGTPKGVPLSHANLLASIRAALMAWRWSSNESLVHALPLTHQHGLSGVHAALLTGSRTSVLSKFDAHRLVSLAEEEGATVLFAVPAMYERLLSLSAEELAPLRRLRLAVSGSAPLSSELAGRVARAARQLPLERYGTTESGLNVSNLFGGPRRVGTVGLPLPGVELRIARPDGSPLPDGRDGEVLVRGPQVFSGYWQQPEETRRAFHPGGWFRTGDIGCVDPATGFLTITGRLKELIISGGLNVYPREVELVLEAHRGVLEAAVAGLPSRRWGERVTAWVVSAPGHAVSGADLVDFARERLAAYKCPKEIFVVDALPRNKLGKLVRRELRRPPSEVGVDR